MKADRGQSWAVNHTFNRDVDFAVIEKHYQAPVANDAAHRYSPSTIRSIENTRVRGNPDMEQDEHVLHRALQPEHADAGPPLHAPDCAFRSS